MRKRRSARDSSAPLPGCQVGSLLIPAQKCDAKRPCTTCVLAHAISGCTYDDEKDPQSEDILPSRSTDAPPSGQHPSGAGTAKIPRATYPPAQLNPTPSTSDITRVVAYEPPILRVPTDDQAPPGPSSGLVIVRRNSPGQRISLDSNPSISIASSFMLPIIPPELQIPLSFLGEERLRVQYSETEATDLDLRSCVPEQECFVTNSPLDVSRLWVLPRLLTFGVQFTPKRLDAFIRGDQSGAVLDRSFVCGAHVLGMLYSKDVDDSPAMIRHHARRGQIAWECLAELFQSKNYAVIAQAVMEVAATYILIRMTHPGILYIQKSCDAIEAGNLQFVPTCGRPPEFSEDLHEVLATLSQTMYWSNYMFLMLGGPEPRATARLEKEFRLDLPVG